MVLQSCSYLNYSIIRRELAPNKEHDTKDDF